MNSLRAAAFVFVLAASAFAPAARAQSTQPAPRPPQRGVLPPQPAATQPAPTATTPAAPGAATPPAAQAAAASPAPAPAEAPPTEAALGAPVYPNSLYLGSYDAGLNQRYYLFGTTAAYSQVLAFYKTALKKGGDEVFDIPPIWTFDIGRYREQTMVYPPSVTVRDHVAGGGKGYLHAAGTEAQRFATVIQIVPPAPGDRR